MDAESVILKKLNTKRTVKGFLLAISRLYDSYKKYWKQSGTRQQFLSVKEHAMNFLINNYGTFCLQSIWFQALQEHTMV